MGRRRASIDWCPASPPVSHTHIDSPSSLLVQQPCCCCCCAAPLTLHRPSLFLHSLHLFSLCLSLLSVVIFVLSVSPQLSAFLSFPFPRRPVHRVLRFSPCRPIIRSLFTLIFSFISRPHTREPRNLHYSLSRICSPPFPLVLRTPDAFFHLFPTASIKAAVFKPVALSSSSLLFFLHPCTRAFKIFPDARLFLLLLLSIERCVALSDSLHTRAISILNKYRKVR